MSNLNKSVREEKDDSQVSALLALKDYGEENKVLVELESIEEV